MCWVAGQRHRAVHSWLLDCTRHTKLLSGPGVGHKLMCAQVDVWPRQQPPSNPLQQLLLVCQHATSPAASPAGVMAKHGMLAAIGDPGMPLGCGLLELRPSPRPGHPQCVLVSAN